MTCVICVCVCVCVITSVFTPAYIHTHKSIRCCHTLSSCFAIFLLLLMVKFVLFSFGLHSVYDFLFPTSATRMNRVVQGMEVNDYAWCLNNALQTVASPLTLCPLNESQLVSVFLRWLHEGCMVLTRAMHLAVRTLQPDGLMLLLSIPYPLDVWCSIGMYVTGICINVLEHRDPKSCWWKCMTADTAKQLNGHSCIHARLFFLPEENESCIKPKAPSPFRGD